MSSKRTVFTSESVTEGHPDKIADGISDAILDAHLVQDKYSRVACETFVATGMVVVGGQITSRAKVPYADIVREKIRKIGYTDARAGFSNDTCAVLVSLDRQSPDISQGVTARKGKEQGAGDQGMMFGFACDETPELMPTPISIAHRLTRRLADVRKKGCVDFLRPDGKSQVSVVYEGGKPRSIQSLVVSSQHTPDVSYRRIREFIIEDVIKPCVPRSLLSRETRIYVNPTGRFVVGGPQGDTGLTGRKIIVDTYGGMGRHGGGAFSGKDPSKVDRSGSYMARYVAKNIVASKLARRCEVQLAYAIGVAEPVAVDVDTFGTGLIPDEMLANAVREVFGLKPAEMIQQLDLLRPIYEPTSSYGHFGHSSRLDVYTWERTDRAAALRKAVR